MKLLQTLNEMAAAQTCGNCGQPMSGNHFYRNMGGKNIRFCKGSALQAAKAAGLNPTGNISFPAGGSAPAVPVSGGSAPSTGSSPRTSSTPSPRQVQPPAPTHKSITKPQLEAWLKDIGVEADQYSVTNGKLNLTTSVLLTEQEYTKLPVPFGKVEGDFEISIPTLTTFKNFPKEIDGNLTVYYSDIENFDDLDVRVSGGVHLAKNDSLTDFRKVHKHIKSVGSGVSVDLDEESNGGIGFLLIPGIQFIQTTNNKIEAILNKYFKDGADLLEIQEELIDSGFKNIARI